jgi:hypothetical protein
MHPNVGNRFPTMGYQHRVHQLAPMKFHEADVRAAAAGLYSASTTLLERHGPATVGYCECAQARIRYPLEPDLAIHSISWLVQKPDVRRQK